MAIFPGVNQVPVRTSSEPLNKFGKPVCGAPNSNGGTCGRTAGTGTTHKGYGRCYLHGGTLQSMSTIVKSGGLGSAISYPDVKEEFDKLKAMDNDVFDLREHIYLIEAIALTVMKHAKNSTDLPLVAKLIKDAARVVKDLDEIEHGRRLVIEVPEVKIILAQIKEVIFRHVPDSHSRDLIGRDLQEISIGGASFTDQPGVDRKLLESGLAVEE